MFWHFINMLIGFLASVLPQEKLVCAPEPALLPTLNPWRSLSSLDGLACCGCDQSLKEASSLPSWKEIPSNFRTIVTSSKQTQDPFPSQLLAKPEELSIFSPGSSWTWWEITGSWLNIPRYENKTINYKINHFLLVYSCLDNESDLIYSLINN